jgi:preprotein translocase subunit SecG
MDVLIVAALGAVIGGYSAKKRGGNRKDMAQYAAVFAVIFALAGLILSIVYTRLTAG